MGPASAAELRDSIRIQRRAITDDGAGNTLGDWADLGTRRCKLTPTTLTAKRAEEVLAARAQGIAYFDCWLYFEALAASITPDDRIVDARDASRTFDVRFAQDMDGDRRFILLQLQIGGPDG